MRGIKLQIIPTQLSQYLLHINYWIFKVRLRRLTDIIGCAFVMSSLNSAWFIDHFLTI